jgi:ABC-type transport system involved in multi-copper enzyme maturation permease subunit
VAGRVLRLTRVELMKLVRHPFFPLSLVLLAAATLLGAWAQSDLFGSQATVWRGPHALLLFAFGAKAGLKLASFLLVIFGSLFFAGEFDKGTIKVLLTRPVTRTDLFIAKCLTGLALAALFIGAVLALSFGFGCLKGELGPVWDSDQYISASSGEQISEHAMKAIRLGVAGVVAAVFLGIAVSTFVESSGFAVAAALTLFIGMDIGLGFMREEKARYLFSWYPSYAFDTLRSYAEGSATRWRPAVEEGSIWLVVPAISAGACTLIGYVLFRVRNILA